MQLIVRSNSACLIKENKKICFFTFGLLEALWFIFGYTRWASIIYIQRWSVYFEAFLLNQQTSYNAKSVLQRVYEIIHIVKAPIYARNHRQTRFIINSSLFVWDTQFAGVNVSSYVARTAVPNFFPP